MVDLNRLQAMHAGDGFAAKQALLPRGNASAFGAI